MLKRGGIFVLISPYTWREDFSKKDQWIGGKEGKSTFEELKLLMNTLCFDFIEEKSFTLLIKEHERKFELIMPHMTVWRKKLFNEEFAVTIFK